MILTSARLNKSQIRDVMKLLRQPEDHPGGKWLEKEMEGLEGADDWRGGRRKLRRKAKQGSRKEASRPRVIVTGDINLSPVLSIMLSELRKPCPLWN